MSTNRLTVAVAGVLAAGAVWGLLSGLSAPATSPSANRAPGAGSAQADGADRDRAHRRQSDPEPAEREQTPDGLGDSDAAEPPATRSRQHWLVRYFTPRPGEDMWSYRDRVLPLVQDALVPQRKRVSRLRDEFAEAANLSRDQLEQIDSIVDNAATRITDRVLQGVLSGELSPRTIKASTGVAFARDILDELDSSHQRFQDTLTSAQRDQLADSRFDIIDYLVFSTRWEDRFGVSW